MRMSLLRVFAIVIALSLFDGSAAAFTQGDNERVETGQFMPEERFIDLFHDAKGRNVTPEATRYIEACCKDKDAAIKLLKDNRFEVKIASGPERVKELNKHWKTEDKSYEEFIFGSRGAGWLRIWRIFTVYKVVLFIKNGKIERVYAAVDTTYP